MDRNVRLALTMCQQDPEDGETVTELSAEAQYFKRDDAHYILYEETAEDGASVKVRIKLKGLLLEVTRRGAIHSHMIFETGREHTMEYTTPFGILMMGVLTHSVKAYLSDNELTIAADYSLTASEAKISQCKITIKIQNRV